jgi:hypothetical protein
MRNVQWAGSIVGQGICREWDAGVGGAQAGVAGKAGCAAGEEGEQGFESPGGVVNEVCLVREEEVLVCNVSDGAGVDCGVDVSRL